MTARPHLLLVHGAWHGPWCFDDLVAVLAADDWTVHAIALPSTGSSTAGLTDDAAAVAAWLAAHPEPTLVVGHSYGGVVVTEGAAAAGNAVGVAYLTAAQLDVGEAVWTDYTSPEEVPPWIIVDAEAGVTTAVNAAEILYGDCPPAVAEASIARLRPQSLASFMTRQSRAAWRDRPSAYLICEQDKCLLPEVQEAVSARSQYIERLPASHSPFLSRPPEVAAFLGHAAARL
jgi:pimeloyl-ACP methyl ester carboxylesterase